MGRPKSRARWFDWAACTGMDTEDFFPLGDGPATGRAMDAAKHVCGRCPVRFACLDDSLAWETPGARYGVVGGLSPAERDALDTDHHELGEAA